MPEARKVTIHIRDDDGAWTPVAGVRNVRLNLNSDPMPVTSAPLRSVITGTVTEVIDGDWAWWEVQRALRRHR